MSNAKIFVFAPVEFSTASGEKEKVGNPLEKLVAEGCEIVEGTASWHTPQGNNEDEMCVFAENADALTGSSIRSSPITRKIMESSDRLRIVAKYTVGYDDVDVEAATDLGILVTNSPTEANWGGVAEGTVAMMLTILKKVRERDEAMKAGKWRHPSQQGIFLGTRLEDCAEGITLGIIGLGRIGRRVATLLAPWRIKILAYDPFVERARFTLHNVIETDLDTLLAESDVVTLHVALTDSSRKMINSKTLAKMKPSAILLNTSRGAVVDEKALVAVLENETIAAAALDVFEDEPLAKNSPLLKLGHKVLLAPHMVSGNSNAGLFPGVVWAVECIENALKGEVPESVINQEILPRWRQRFGNKAIIG
ncbi:MAG: NAD(P)-dependent oxidoreductase [Hyphomicrobiales bacterium]|nr:NAD(P)-dependent oxidoreductase [Hyphomicrobiales bacterium]